MPATGETSLTFHLLRSSPCPNVRRFGTRAERERNESGTRAERERNESGTRAERERNESGTRAERERNESGTRAERERNESGTRAERERNESGTRAERERGEREGQSTLAGVHGEREREGTREERENERDRALWRVFTNRLGKISSFASALHHLSPKQIGLSSSEHKPKCRRLRKSLLCPATTIGEGDKAKLQRGANEIDSYAVINSRARRRRYTRRCPCGVRIASTTDGLPATHENSLPKSATNSHQLELAIPKRSRTGGTQAGVEPRFPSTDCRAVQSSRSK